MTGIMKEVTERYESALTPIGRWIARRRWTRTHNRIDKMIREASDPGTVKAMLAYDILIDDCMMLTEWLENMEIDKNGQLHIDGDTIPRNRVADWLNDKFYEGDTNL